MSIRLSSKGDLGENELQNLNTSLNNRKSEYMMFI